MPHYFGITLFNIHECTVTEHTKIIVDDILTENQEVIHHTVIAHANSAIIMELLKQNNEFKALIIEQNKQMLELINKSNFAV